MHIVPLQLLIQGAVFLIVWFLLNQLFFKPFSRVYEKRSSKTVKAIEAAKLSDKESEELESQLRMKINDAMASANEMKLSVIADAKTRREDTVRQANEVMQKQLQSMLAQIVQEKDALIARVDAEVKQFVPLISGKMMLK